MKAQREETLNGQPVKIKKSLPDAGNDAKKVTVITFKKEDQQ